MDHLQYKLTSSKKPLFFKTKDYQNDILRPSWLVIENCSTCR